MAREYPLCYVRKDAYGFDIYANPEGLTQLQRMVSDAVADGNWARYRMPVFYGSNWYWLTLHNAEQRDFDAGEKPCPCGCQDEFRGCTPGVNPHGKVSELIPDQADSPVVQQQDQVVSPPTAAPIPDREQQVYAVIQAAIAVVSGHDQAGCSSDLTVCTAADVAVLRRALQRLTGQQYGQELDPVDWEEVYPDGVCPDCQEPIPTATEEGESCKNCGHVFWSDPKID